MTMGDPCRFLEWDSNHFGRRIAQVEGSCLTPESVRLIGSWCEKESIECIYFLADAGDAASVRLAEDAGFRLVDVRMTLEHELRGLPEEGPESGSARVRLFQPSDIARLRQIARSSHTGTRFFRDPGFSRSRSEDLYDIWISKSCSAEAQAVFVAGPGNDPSGYLTCHLEGEGAGKIGLLAVAPEARGKGAGHALVLEALRWFGQRSVRRVSVVLQGGNIPAQRVYQKCGFLGRSLQIWYHRWLMAAGGRIA
jgi:dTDP-4-amino-4,6-dideoxy-D-galactose acyltransferase